jgi:hypothetical protein
MTQEALITAVQKQRTKLLNVLGAVQCTLTAIRHEPPMELEGAVGLLEDEVQRIINALDPVELERAVREEGAG